MKIIKTKTELTETIHLIKQNKQKIGFVPTMGALHKGHISLVAFAKTKVDYIVVSIFVNPTQFNNPADLKKYPKTETHDLKMLKDAGVDLVFMPEVIEIYPENEANKIYDFGGIDRLMEGKHRPGHFNGVGLVLEKLFMLVRSDFAFFGQKDFQQAAIVRYLVEKYLPNLGLEIITCPIVREPDGLAMSSRNLLLTQEHRKAAPLIHHTLAESKGLTISTNKIIEYVISKINTNENLETEYFEIVDNDTLLPVTKIIQGKTTGCIAVFAGEVRLIDNISY